MASGANNTARQLGIATGIAGAQLLAGTSASSNVHELARAVASGGTGRALEAVPPADHEGWRPPRTMRS
jgi:hypothetical protein